MQKTLDIQGGRPWPSGALSNFAGHAFMFRGVACASMEGLLQSFKVKHHALQILCCSMEGVAAKKYGSRNNAVWQRRGLLWWAGVMYERESDSYQALLTEAYNALFFHSEAFRRALLATGDAQLTHEIGRDDIYETILTEAEFVGQLHRLRSPLSLLGVSLGGG